MVLGRRICLTIEVYYVGNHSLYSHDLDPLRPTSDQDRISPYTICTISSRQVTRNEKNVQFTFNSKFSKLSKKNY